MPCTCINCAVQGQRQTIDISLANELSSDELDVVFKIMKENFGHMFGGLQHTGMGAYAPGLSMPRFTAVGSKRFVQILHQPDHWICATNLFSESSHDVFLYDSLYSFIETSTVAQITSLLRDEDKPDIITFHIRKFRQQELGTRLCGFYAVAAAFSCCLNIDPTGLEFDKFQLQRHLQQCLKSRKVTAFPSINTGRISSTTVVRKKLHCLCQNQSTKNMVQCSFCSNWYHTKCVNVDDKQLLQVSLAWRGPCCDSVGPIIELD